MGGFLRWRKRRLRARSRASAIPTLCQLDPSVPDPEWGESVASVIVLREECAGVDADTLIAFCRDHLGSFKKPKRIEFVTELPKNAYGKVLRRDLRDRFNWRH
jgi:acyl-CoA synthetase (AMP-forming)/AMP-acid ligase II